MYEDCLPSLGRPGHCSACSLAEWEGASHGSLVATLASSQHRAGDGRKLLTGACRGFKWVHHDALARNFVFTASSSRQTWSMQHLASCLEAAVCREELLARGMAEWSCLSNGRSPPGTSWAAFVQNGWRVNGSGKTCEVDHGDIEVGVGRRPRASLRPFACAAQCLVGLRVRFCSPPWNCRDGRSW